MEKGRGARIGGLSLFSNCGRLPRRTGWALDDDGRLLVSAAVSIGEHHFPGMGADFPKADCQLIL
jgi:hypothetical protein